MLPNPVKKYRQQLGYSISQLETYSGIHRQVIIRAEQGCYATIPPRLYSYLVSHLGEGNPSLAADYSSWVAAKRVDGFGKLPIELPAFQINEHPFIAWRESAELSRLAVCKTYCIHLSTLSRFETNLQQQTIPVQLTVALLTAGYSNEIIDDLHNRFTYYREYQLARHAHDDKRIAEVQEAAQLNYAA